MKTVLFQGDSITDMAHIDSAADMNHIYGHSYVFLLAAYLGAEYPTNNIKIINKGVSGDRLEDMSARYKTDTLPYNPDIISILIGINDILQLADAEIIESDIAYKNRFQSLIDKTKAALPKTTIVICEPFCFPEAANEKYKGVLKKYLPLYSSAAKQIAEENNLIFVPLREKFEKAYQNNPQLGYKHWIWDGVHPTAAGHMLIAKQWLKYVNII